MAWGSRAGRAGRTPPWKRCSEDSHADPPTAWSRPQLHAWWGPSCGSRQEWGLWGPALSPTRQPPGPGLP